MRNVNILDASAILAYLQGEKGQDLVESVFEAGEALATAVNYCEVLSKLCEKGMPQDDAESSINDLGITIIDFDIRLVRHAAAIRKRTIPIGASLGDRACLALAHHLHQNQSTPIIYTAESSWTKIKWPFKVVLIRPANSRA